MTFWLSDSIVILRIWLADTTIACFVQTSSCVRCFYMWLFSVQRVLYHFYWSVLFVKFMSTVLTFTVNRMVLCWNRLYNWQKVAPISPVQLSFWVNEIGSGLVADLLYHACSIVALRGLHSDSLSFHQWWKRSARSVIVQLLCQSFFKKLSLCLPWLVHLWVKQLSWDWQSGACLPWHQSLCRGSKFCVTWYISEI